MDHDRSKDANASKVDASQAGSSELDVSALDALVDARLELLDRWTSAIRHELGNVLYPSQTLLAAAAQEPGPAGELAARVRDLMDTIDHNRASLACLRPVARSDADGAAIVGEWWAATRHLLRAIVGRQVRCSGPADRDHALPATAKGLTAITLPIFVALDLQSTVGPLKEVVVASERGELTLTITATGPGIEHAALPRRARDAARMLGCALEMSGKAGLWGAVVRWPG
ncbi:MAG: hypothetical protein ACIAQU_05950 [Phycisphaerales bacterium JB064]